MTPRLILEALWMRRQHRARERWNRAALEAFQARGLAEIRRFALERFAFYRRFHRGLEHAPLEQLPVLTKAELMGSFDEVVTDSRLRLRDVEKSLRDTPRSQGLTQSKSVARLVAFGVRFAGGKGQDCHGEDADPPTKAQHEPIAHWGSRALRGRLVPRGHRPEPGGFRVPPSGSVTYQNSGVARALPRITARSLSLSKSTFSAPIRFPIVVGRFPTRWSDHDSEFVAGLTTSALKIDACTPACVLFSSPVDAGPDATL